MTVPTSSFTNQVTAFSTAMSSGINTVMGALTGTQTGTGNQANNGAAIFEGGTIIDMAKGAKNKLEEAAKVS